MFLIMFMSVRILSITSLLYYIFLKIAFDFIKHVISSLDYKWNYFNCLTNLEKA